MKKLFGILGTGFAALSLAAFGDDSNTLDITGGKTLYTQYSDKLNAAYDYELVEYEEASRSARNSSEYSTPRYNALGNMINSAYGILENFIDFDRIISNTLNQRCTSEDLEVLANREAQLASITNEQFDVSEITENDLLNGCAGVDGGILVINGDDIVNVIGELPEGYDLYAELTWVSGGYEISFGMTEEYEGTIYLEFMNYHYDYETNTLISISQTEYNLYYDVAIDGKEFYTYQRNDSSTYISSYSTEDKVYYDIVVDTANPTDYYYDFVLLEESAGVYNVISHQTFDGLHARYTMSSELELFGFATYDLNLVHYDALYYDFEIGSENYSTWFDGLAYVDTVTPDYKLNIYTHLGLGNKNISEMTADDYTSLKDAIVALA